LIEGGFESANGWALERGVGCGQAKNFSTIASQFCKIPLGGSVIARLFGRFGILGHFVAALSIAWLLGEAMNHGWAAPFAYIFKVYNVLKMAIFSPFEPYIEAFVRSVLTWLPSEWRLQRHWHDIFVLLTLYFGARAGAYRKAGLKYRAAFRYALGLATSGLTALFAGLVLADSARSNALLAVIPIIGILMFEIVDSAVSASVARKEGLPWFVDMVRYLKFSLPILGTGFVGIIGANWAFRDSEAARSNSLALFCLLGFTVTLAAYWGLRGYLFARPIEHREPGEGVWHRFKRSSNTEIAMAMTSALVLAFLILASSAGYEVVGALM
jgi:hypothetical protein